MPAPLVIRTLELRGPSARDEAASVARGLAAIFLGALLVVGSHASSDRDGSSARASLEAPDYQVLFRDLAPAQQRMYRAMQEGLTEAENLRPSLGDWPAPEALSAEGVPPFAVDPLGPNLNWSLLRSGTDALYLGRPSGGVGPAYLLVVQEPPAGTPGDPASTPLDETHHRLSTGVIFHVSFWEHLAGALDVTPSVLARPYLGGWKQMLMSPPSLSRPSPER